jgi:N-acyl-D-aspartate/D-glutamate deacylase
MNSDFDDEEYELAWMTKLARETGRPVWFLLTDRYEDPARWRRLIKTVHEARANGLPLTAQIAGRPIGVMMGIGTALSPFTVRPSSREIERLSLDEQRARLRDPEVRRRILSEKPSEVEVAKLAQFRQLITTRWDKFFVWVTRRTTSRRQRKALPPSPLAKAARPTRLPMTTSLRPKANTCISRR